MTTRPRSGSRRRTVTDSDTKRALIIFASKFFVYDLPGGTDIAVRFRYSDGRCAQSTTPSGVLTRPEWKRFLIEKEKKTIFMLVFISSPTRENGAVPCFRSRTIYEVGRFCISINYTFTKTRLAVVDVSRVSRRRRPGTNRDVTTRRPAFRVRCWASPPVVRLRLYTFQVVKKLRKPRPVTFLVTISWSHFSSFLP